MRQFLDNRRSWPQNPRYGCARGYLADTGQRFQARYPRRLSMAKPLHDSLRQG
jgi:hypothetical protein